MPAPGNARSTRSASEHRGAQFRGPKRGGRALAVHQSPSRVEEVRFLPAPHWRQQVATGSGAFLVEARAVGSFTQHQPEASMSLEDLEIKKHTAPILAELDRQKEKAAAFKAERDSLRAQLAARDRDYSGSATVAAMDSLTTQRDALNEKLLEAQHALGAIDCALNPPNGGNYTQRQVLEIIKGLMGDKAHCSELVQQVKEARAQRDAAVEALDRYGKHERACINQGAYNTNCVCGFSAALLRAKEQR